MNPRVKFRYLGNHPDEASAPWSEGAQGIAHDDDHWFFTSAELLIKIPIAEYVAPNVLDWIGRIDEMPAVGIPNRLADFHQTMTQDELDDYANIGYPVRRAHYNHFGDLDCFGGFLFIPMTGSAIWTDANGDERKRGLPPIVAVFSPDDLSFVASAPLDRQTGAGWLAINPKDGRLYSTNNHMNDSNGLFAHDIDMAALAEGRDGFLSFHRELYLDLPYDLRHMQGGVFDPHRYLYLVNGYIEDFDADDGGIHVFDMDRDGAFVERSSQGGEGLRYQFDCSFPKYEEPEGITWWDLDADTRAHSTSGQLHVILLDNDWPDGDDVYVKHYRVTDVVEPLPYLTHSLASEQPVPVGTGASGVSDVKGVGLSRRWRHLVDGKRLVRMDRETMPSQAFGASGGITTTDLADDLDRLASSGETLSLGGPTAVDGFLFIPVLGGSPRALVLDESSYSRVGVFVPPGGGVCHWLTVNPRNRELYCGGQSGEGRRYHLDWDRLHREAVIDATLLSPLRFVDPVGESRPLVGVLAAAVDREGSAIYMVGANGIEVYGVTDGRLVDASRDELLNEGKGPSFNERPGAGERAVGVALWPDNSGNPLVEVFISNADGGLRWLAFRPAPDEGGVGIGFVGNRRSLEFHRHHCPWAGMMAAKNKVFFSSPLRATEAGYNGCRFCMSRWDTDR